MSFSLNFSTNKSNTDNVIERPKKVNESSIVVKKEDEIVEYEGLDMCFVRIIDKIPDLNYALLASKHFISMIFELLMFILLKFYIFKMIQFQ